MILLSDIYYSFFLTLAFHNISINFPIVEWSMLIIWRKTHQRQE
jgi:hypothetical protein